MGAADQTKETGCFPRVPIKNLFGSKRHGSIVERTRLRLDGKVAVITGAASGIGAATARLFVSQGARVIIADIQVEAGRKLSSELGSSAHFFHCDVTKEADVAAAVNYAAESWGHLDIMFNNAGVPGPIVGLADINMEEFDEVIGVHIKGAVLGVKHAARVMIPAGKGVILFSGSTSAKMGGAGPPLHSAANAAVLCIVRSAAAELVRHGIRVNAVSPHCVATPMTIDTFKASMNPAKDITVEQFEKILASSSELDVLTTEKVASAVMFLASDDAGFISGHNLVLDGGFSVTKQFDSSDLKEALQKSLEAERTADTESKKELQSPVSSREGSDTSELSKAPIAKEPEMEDKASDEEKTREKEDKAAKKVLANKEKKKKQRGVKEIEKRETERKIEEEKARAKQEKAQTKEDKARAKEGQAPATDPKTQAKEARDVHPLDKKVLAKEERIKNENIELPNAGPEPDIPLEYQPRPPVKKFGSLLNWRKDSKKEGKTEDRSTDPGMDSKIEKNDNKSTSQRKVSTNERKDDKSTDPGKASKDEAKFPAEEEIAPETQPKQSRIKSSIGNLLNWGKDSTEEGKTEDEDTDPGKPSKKEAKFPAEEEITPESEPKQSQGKTSIGNLLNWGKDSTKEGKTENKAIDPGKASKKEKKEEKSADPGNVSKQEKKQEKSTDGGKILKKEPDSPAKQEITPESQPEQSPVQRIGAFLSWGKGSTKQGKTEDKAADPGQASKTEKKDYKSADPGKVSKQETKEGKPTDKGKASNQEEKSPTDEEITPESQPKQSKGKSSIGSLLNRGKDSAKEGKTEDKATDPGKVSKKEKKDEKSADPGNVSKQEKMERKSTDKGKASKQESKSPAGEEITPESQPKQSKVKTSIGSLLNWGKDSAKEGKTEDRAADPGKVPKTEKKDEKSADPGNVSKQEKMDGKSTDKGKASTKEPKSLAKEEPAPESQLKQPPVKRIGRLLSWGKDPSKEGQTKDKSADPGKVKKKEKKVVNFADPEKEEEGQTTDPAKASRKEAKSPAKEEISPGIQPKEVPVKRKGSLLSPAKVSTKEGKKEDKSTDPGKVSKNEKKEAKSADPGSKVSEKEAKSSAKDEKARHKSKDSPKTPASPAITLEPRPKQSPLTRVGSLLGLGMDPTKKQAKSADPGKVSNN